MQSGVLLWVLLLVATTAKQGLLASHESVQEEKKTVVEANHFYSNYELFTNYDIGSVKKDRPLLLMLKPNKQVDLKVNPITITLTSGDKVAKCPFTSYQGLCAFDNVEKTSINMKLECKKTPC